MLHSISKTFHKIMVRSEYILPFLDLTCTIPMDMLLYIQFQRRDTTITTTYPVCSPTPSDLR